MGRDPKEPIAEILASKQPLFEVMKLVNEMLQNVKTLDNRPFWQAVLFRDALLIKLLQVNPLRLMMFSIMQVGRHIVKKNGVWWIEFKKNEFKNRQFLTGDYKVRLSPEAWEILEEYISVYRPRLPGADKYPHLFLPAISRLRNKNIEAYVISPRSLSDAVNNRTKTFIEGSSGFRTQAFRHILATDIVKNNPLGGFDLASFALHDNVKTVEENYSHLLTNDTFEAYNDYYTQATNSFKLINSGSYYQSSDRGKNDDEEAEF